MFEFFKDIYSEINGLDPDKLRDEKRMMKEKKEKKFFNYKTKILITACGVLYLILSFTNLSIIIQNGFNPIAIKYILLSLLALAIMITIHFQKKEIEIASTVGIIIFIVLNFTIKNI